MPELTFNLAKRLFKYRSCVARACKTNLLPVPDGTEYRDEPLGMLALPFFPRKRAAGVCRKVLTASLRCRNLKDGWWTNGFALLKNPPEVYRNRRREKELSNMEALLTPREPVVLGCLLYYRRAQDSPMAALLSETEAMLFQLLHLDSVIYVAAKHAAAVRLSFNTSGTGLVVAVAGEPVAYLARLEPPAIFGAALLAHARKYYAHCRNRPQPV